MFVCSGGLDSPGEARFVGSSLPQLSAREVVDALSQWDGMEDTVSLFTDLLRESSGIYTAASVPLLCVCVIVKSVARGAVKWWFCDNCCYIVHPTLQQCGRFSTVMCVL